MNLRTLTPLLVSLVTGAASSVFAQAAEKPASPAPSTVQGIAPLTGQPNLLASGVPAVPPELRKRVLQYLESRSANLMDVSQDGKQVLISTRFADTNQLHVVEQPMGARFQLTFTPEPINTARFLPTDPNVLFFLQDVGGGEFFQVYRLDRRNGRSELLTDGKSRHEELAVSDDGRWLAYGGTGRNGKDTDVYVAPTDNPKQARRITESEGTWYPVGFSRDGSKLLVTQFRAADDSDLHVVDVKTGERRQLTPKEGKGSVNRAVLTPDGKSVFLVTDRYGDFAALYKLDLDKAPYTAAPPSLTGSLRWDVESIALSPDGKTLAVETNEDGYGKLYLLDTKRGALSPVEVPRGVITDLVFPRGRSDVLTYAISTSKSPTDVYQADLRTKKSTRWTRSEVGGLDTSTFVEPELVHYKSTDGVQVPAFLYLPRGREGKVPVVLIFHGGPEGQSRPNLSTFTQFLAVELGMAVLVPNVRGSEGYGKAYRAMDDGVKREQSLADIGSSLDYISSRPELDASRVGVYGGSYGGYMVLATAAFFPERVRAAVDVVGISSLPTFLQNTQAYRRDLRRAEYGDERDPEVRKVQERISPLNSVDRIKAALFVQQGANDPRVPQSEAEQIVKAVRARGTDVWYLLALDEGHGFGKKANRDTITVATFLFLEKYLGAPTAPAGGSRP
ncbi:alpha/beta fold hydrolase [Vitiosangium sp. GDMCC 1.1324]|uniref:S9 family peptidase n=1 Tax=Vitiosangium sp. (strain GDMCC 1.1324) TaxID=2138576 RepID=UPI000D3383B6|nr:alpha/beta fold hydrolase [Vitiosangium sp. GDMCC 1.1324]PTL84646.1 S9 family peptidase [Vitiosangium sp. GDMCC 1.1324]